MKWGLPPLPQEICTKGQRWGGQEAFIVGTTEEEIKKEELRAIHTVCTGFGGIFSSGRNRFCVILYIFH